MNKPTIGLWDGDALIWRFGFIDNKSTCIKSLNQFIAEKTNEIGLKDNKFFIGDSNKSNFRYKVYPKYKSSRKDTVRPVNEKCVIEYLTSSYRAKVITGAEVDDALGIMQCAKYKRDSIILSNDKDLDMIPGWHYDIDYLRPIKYKDTVQLRKAYKKKAMYYVKDPGFLSLRKHNGKKILCGAGQLWFCAQMLLGDSADDIPGIGKLGGIRFGSVSAYNALKDCDTFDKALNVVYTLYKNNVKEDIDKVFKTNYKLLWIKRKNGREDVIIPE